MNMIAKYSGKCLGCGGPIQKGAEIDYDYETKGAWHFGCTPEEGYAVNEQDELADRLNYRNYTWEQLTKRVNPNKGD